MLKTLAKFAFAVLLVVVSVSLIIEMKYSISLAEYLAYSVPLTREEQQYLSEKELFIYGVDAEAAPFSSLNEKTGQCEGLIIDYMSFLSLELGIEIQCKTVAQSEILDELKANTIDMTDLFVDTGGKHRYISTQNLYELEGVMVTKYANEKIKQYRDLQGKTLVLIEGDYLENCIMKVFPKGQSIDISYVESVKEGLQLLMDDEADALVANETIINYYAKNLQIENDLRQIGDKVYKEDVTLAVNIYDTKLYNILNKAVLKLKKKNVFGESQEKWLGTSAPMVTGSTSVKWAQWIIIFCVGVVVILMVWESVLNRRIDQKTREIKIEKNNLQTIIDNINALVAVINGNDVITQCNDYGKVILKDIQGSFIGCGIGTVKMLNELYGMYRENPDKQTYCYEERYYSIFVRTLSSVKANRLLMIEDCTEKTLTERKLRQESKMIAVGQLSSGLAHEIRNPLGLIKNYSYILRDYAADDMACHSLDVIKDSTNRIDNLIENLLSFSRLSNDKPEPLNVEKLLQNIIDLEKKKLEKQNVTLSFSCPKDLIITTWGETIKIVAFNLIDNAIEAFRETDQGKGRLRFRVELERGVLRLDAVDDGPGISEAIIENIFNPFFTTKDTGTGLGLYIVSSELEKINGHISVKSRLGAGSVFSVEIPVEE